MVTLGSFGLRRRVRHHILASPRLLNYYLITKKYFPLIGHRRVVFSAAKPSWQPSRVARGG